MKSIVDRALQKAGREGGHAWHDLLKSPLAVNVAVGSPPVPEGWREGDPDPHAVLWHGQRLPDLPRGHPAGAQPHD